MNCSQVFRGIRCSGISFKNPEGNHILDKAVVRHALVPRENGNRLRRRLKNARGGDGVEQFITYVRLDGWMDGWMDGRMDGWMVDAMDGQAAELQT